LRQSSEQRGRLHPRAERFLRHRRLQHRKRTARHQL